jgi:hypothetical protein
MAPAPEDSAEQREHELTMHIFAVSAAMVGVCLTGIGLLRVVVARSQIQTLGDDLLAANALAFMVSCLLSFWSFKTHDSAMRARLRGVTDTIFLFALVFMVLVCVLIAHALI